MKPTVLVLMCFMLLGCCSNGSGDDSEPASCLRTENPDPSAWHEPRLFHQPFDDAFADRIVISKSPFPAALLTPVHSPNKAYYYMAVKPDFTREGPWSTEVYLYAENEQMTRVDLLDHSAYAPELKWINEKLLFIRIWWGRQLGTDLIIDVETDRIVSKEMIEDGRLLFEQYAESSKVLEEQGAVPDLGTPVEELRRMLASGTPEEKETALDSFTEHFQPDLVPDVIAAILDDTRLPRHGDTGWGTVHHYAATAMCACIEQTYGISPDRRTYSFYDDGGVAPAERRELVYENMRVMWENLANAQHNEYLEQRN